MKHLGMIAVAATALTLAGCGKKAETTDPAGSDMAAASDAAMPSTPAVSEGQAFANTAATSDTFEIETSKLAAAKAGSAKVKTFAAQMIKAHTESTAKLMSAAAAASPAIVPAPQLTPAQQQTLDMLGTKSGADFDTAYAKAQIDAHQATLDGLKAYAASGAVPTLKTFAGGLVATVTAHLNMAKAL